MNELLRNGDPILKVFIVHHWRYPETHTLKSQTSLPET